ncbi:hypothetical protein OSTOST_08901 [Ostertagia ostertagi]
MTWSGHITTTITLIRRPGSLECRDGRTGGAGERTSPSHSQRSNMGQASSQLPEHQLEQLSIESGLSRSGIVTLYKRFLSLATHRDKETNEHFLTEIDFQSIAELQQNPLGQRIIDAFFADAE